MSDKLTKEQVGYESKATMKDDCDECRNFVEGGSCRQVEGSISPDGWCTIFNSKNPFHILGQAAEKPCVERDEDQMGNWPVR